jgi:hypothetical protein
MFNASIYPKNLVQMFEYLPVLRYVEHHILHTWADLNKQEHLHKIHAMAATTWTDDRGSQTRTSALGGGL